MSLHYLGQTFSYSRARGSTFAVALALADYADAEGECWPAWETIARKARVSRRTVARSIAELIDLGELAVTAGAGEPRIKGRPDTARKSTTYRLTALGPPPRWVK